MSPVRFRLFLACNLAGAAVWALTFGLGGYYGGQALLPWLEGAKHVQIAVLAGLALGGLGFLLWRFLAHRRAGSKAP